MDENGQIAVIHRDERNGFGELFQRNVNAPRADRMRSERTNQSIGEEREKIYPIGAMFNSQWQMRGHLVLQSSLQSST